MMVRMTLLDVFAKATQRKTAQPPRTHPEIKEVQRTVEVRQPHQP
jgi:hypothetical protein